MKFELKTGMTVVATDPYYEGLAGYIERLKVERDETDNENLEEMLVVTLYETPDMEKTHPDLNGTGVDELIMGTDELIFFPNGKIQTGFDIEGNEYQFAKVAFSYEDDILDELI